MAHAVTDSAVTEAALREYLEREGVDEDLVVRRVRRLRIPEVLQPLLARLAALKGPNDFLFGPKANRWWLRSAVRRICSVAQTPVVNPHGLRGTHATLAVQAGVTGDAVAAALGHESFAVTASHYAKPEAVLGARTHQIEESLGLRKFRSGSAGNPDAA
jgi:integrase